LTDALMALTARRKIYGYEFEASATTWAIESASSRRKSASA